MKNKEYEKAIKYLMEQIKQGVLTIGSRLPAERTIAETLSISRNSTREALRTLENMGIIESRRGSGNYLICNFSNTISNMMNMMILLRKTSPKEICEFRRQMEKTTCSIIIKRNCISTIALENILNQTPHTADEESAQDKDFHYRLIHMTENQILISIMEAIHDSYVECIHNTLRASDKKTKLLLNQCHKNIAASIKEKDIEKLYDAIDSHYDIIENTFDSPPQND